MQQLSLIDAIKNEEHKEYLDNIESHLQVAKDNWDKAQTIHDRNDAMIEWHRIFDMKCGNPELMLCFFCKAEYGPMKYVFMTPHGFYRNWPDVKRICGECQKMADEHMQARERQRKAYGIKL